MGDRKKVKVGRNQQRAVETRGPQHPTPVIKGCVWEGWRERERGKDVEVGGDVVGLAVSSSEIDGVHILN